MNTQCIKKYADMVLCLVAALFLCIYYYAKPQTKKLKRPYYNQMIAAAHKMDILQKAILKEMMQRRIEVDRSIDKTASGLVGTEWSGITTTLGSVESKRTTVNPDFAALLARLFLESGLKKGDCIAANCSGSFPALNLACIAAADTVGLDAIMVTSVGSSMYGGNREDFTYLDMEQHLYRHALIRNKSTAYSLGGQADIGREFNTEALDPIKKRLDSYGLTFFYEEDFKQNLQSRYAFYMSSLGKSPKAFINIGGNLLSLGEYNEALLNEKILLNPASPARTGLVGLFLKSGIPVFYLLNIKSIALYYALPFDPDTFPVIGTSGIYYYLAYNTWNYAIIGIFTILIIVSFAVKVHSPIKKI